MKPYLITSAASLLLTAIFMTFVYRQFSLLSFVNSGAVAALIFFVLGCLIYVVGGGFYYYFAYSFKRFYKRTSRRGQLLAKVEEDKEEDFPRPKTFKSVFTYPLLVVGVILFLVTLALSNAVA